MTKLDHSLIYLKSENARISLKGLSNYLKKSIQRLKYSVSSLEREGVLSKPYCVFDYSYFGLILFRIYFKEGYVNEQSKKGIIDLLDSNPYITSIYELIGEFGLVVEFASPNPSKFNKELKKLIELDETLNDYKVALNIVTHIYPRQYLIKDTKLQFYNLERVIGGDRNVETFNKNEISIIKNLFLTPTISLTNLSRKSNLNIKTVKSVMSNLTSRNVVKGFKYVVDKNKIEIYNFRLFLKLHNLTAEKEAEFMKYMVSTKDIIQLNKTVGDWDIEIDIESLDKNRIREIILETREKFKDIIEKFNLIEIYKCHKKSYLPKYLFNF